MNHTLLCLKTWGCAIDLALDRVLDDETLLLDLIQQVSQDDALKSLGIHLLRADCTAAFEDAHVLKGICANTGVTPLYDIIVQLIEPLRAGNVLGLLPLYHQLIAKNQELQAILNDPASSDGIHPKI